jgi:hypothetical protein
LRFRTPEGEQAIRPRATILALGGASWPRLGSDGSWRDLLLAKGVNVTDLQPANCGFAVPWSEVFRDRFEGQPLKTVTLSSGTQTSRGEMVVTRDGIEGGGVYALSAALREDLLRNDKAILHADLRPDLSRTDLITRLSQPRHKQSTATFLRKAAGLSPVAIGLLQEDSVRGGIKLGEVAPERLAERIQALPIQITGIAPLARAISTAGGVLFDDIDEKFMLRKLPAVFVAGEMLDWDAPTGGYLLQASFATGIVAGRGALEFLRGKHFGR